MEGAMGASVPPLSSSTEALLGSATDTSGTAYSKQGSAACAIHCCMLRHASIVHYFAEACLSAWMSMFHMKAASSMEAQDGRQAKWLHKKCCGGMVQYLCQ